MYQMRHKVTKSLVIGTAETVLATATILGFSADGDFEYAGDSKVHWDSQRTLEKDGKLLFVTEDGEECTMDELEPVPTE